MEEARGELHRELGDLVREARALIGRERSRGRFTTTRASVAEKAPAEDPRTRADAEAPTAVLLETSAATIQASHPPAAPLRELAGLVAACRRCSLCRTRTQTVFADGSPSARLLFVGEAPGRDEDAQGLPFVGRAGQLLNKMIAAIELRREEVYICNVLKCRPPDNRVPAPDEVEQCLPFLEQQIALVKPALICALGLSAAQALLQTKSSMSSMRGKTFAFRGVPLIPTYHPAALLRNPGLKREAWVDLQRVRDTLRQRSAS